MLDYNFKDVTDIISYLENRISIDKKYGYYIFKSFSSITLSGLAVESLLQYINFLENELKEKEKND